MDMNINTDAAAAPFSMNDVRLIQEAVRRAETAAASRGALRNGVVAAIVAEARRGTRDLHGLVRAGLRGEELVSRAA